MASFLLSECLENIFSNFIKHSSDARIKIFTKDLYSCTLVSRYWCRISTPFLYAYPVHYFTYNLWSPPEVLYSTYFKLIRTLLSCIPQSEIRQIYTSYAQVLSTKYIPFNKKVSYSSFNYISFIRGFILEGLILESRNVCHYKNIWLSAHNSESISSVQIIIRIMNYFVNFLFKHSNNLAILEISYYRAEHDAEFFQLISSIPLQKKLQHIILSSSIWDNVNHSTVFNLLTQSESLQTLEFQNLSFYKIDEKALNSLCLLKKISKLKLHNCEGVNDLSTWAKSLIKLKVFETTINYYPSHEKDFLIQLFQSSSNTLTKLVININKIRSQDFTQTFQIFQQIPLYLHSLSHLELPEVLPTELIPILKSCIKLVYLSVRLNNDGDLKGLGEFVPKNLERIQFKLFTNETSFKESLKCFLEGYINNNGALKHLEFGHNYFGQVDSFVIYGIQITVSQDCLWKV